MLAPFVIVAQRTHVEDAACDTIVRNPVRNGRVQVSYAGLRLVPAARRGNRYGVIESAPRKLSPRFSSSVVCTTSATEVSS